MVTRRAIVDGRVIAQSDDIVEDSGYQYFPPSAVRLEWLQKTPRTDSDLKCPHGVQFYDVVIDGVRHERAAWCYEAPRESKRQIGWRYGFWKDVQVA
ncbi:MAG TPA: DUF427 domain-containing protein [Xanthobacteraceae bacterium]|jgi:uncharacterized protein (DUF427 family)